MSRGARSREGWMSKAKGLAPRVLRVVLLFAALYAIVVVWVAHRAKADVQEIMLGLGAEMLHYPDAREGRVRRLSLNGASIYMRTATSDRLVPEALDYFESRCNQRDGRVLEQFQELEAEGHLDLGELDPAEADSTLRFETSARGFVSCLDMGEGRQGYEGLLDRVGAFVESGDLSRVGQMRYVYAERVGEGEEESSFLLSFWSEGELNIYEMFPAAGDAPGVDPADVPRPASSRRILSMVEEGRPYGMTLYVTDSGTPESLEARYQSILPSHGWELVEPTDAAQWEERMARLEGARMVVATQADRLVALVFGTDEESSETTVTVLVSDDV